MQQTVKAKNRAVLKHLCSVICQIDVSANPANKHRVLNRVLYLKTVENGRYLHIAELLGVNNAGVSGWIKAVAGKVKKLQNDSKYLQGYFRNDTNGFLMYLLLHDTNKYPIANQWFDLYNNSHKPVKFGTKRLYLSADKRKRAEHFEYLLMKCFLSFADIGKIYGLSGSVISEQVVKDGYMTKVKSRYKPEIAEKYGFADDLGGFMLWVKKNAEKSVFEQIERGFDAYQSYLKEKVKNIRKSKSKQ